MSGQMPTLDLIENNRAGGGIGIGNYKGVMLCNRPFNTMAVQGPAAKAGRAVSDNTPFVCGAVGGDVGQNVPISSKEMHVIRPKQETALQKHKRWLAELQRTKEMLEQQYMDELAKKEAARAKFVEREAKLRRAARETNTADQDGQEEQQRHQNSKQHEEKYELESFQRAPNKASALDSDDTVASESKTIKTISSKPMWAMTEGEAEVAAQAKEDEELDNLLSFAKGLDFDKYIDDLEVQSMMEQVRHRIKQLEVGVAQEQRDVQALLSGTVEEARNVLARMPSKLADMQDKNVELQREDSDDDMLSVAKSVLSESSRSVRTIHSTRSLNQIALKAKERLKAPDENSKHHNVQLGESVRKYEEPKIATAETGNEFRVENQKRLSNLPYMNRNPAV